MKADRGRNEIAVIMAAGMGMRMRPLTLDTPKPLVRVNGKPMIETVIEGLWKRGIGEIYVITGYLSSAFDYLSDKYSDLHLIHNPEFDKKNNISSLYYACPKMRGHSVFICEADLYIWDDSIFYRDFTESCYFGKMVKGHSDDWVFYQNDSGRIVRVCKGGDELYNMVGISYFRKEDVEILADAIEEAYADEGNGDLFWDEVVDKNLDRLNLCVNEVDACQIGEYDTIEELAEVDDSYRSMSFRG